MRSASTTISAFDTLHQLDSSVADVDEVPAQDPVVRLAPRVDADRRTDLPLAARLVDVAVDRQDRLTLFGRPTTRGRADWAAEDVAGGDGGAEVLIEDRRRIEARVVRRHVDHEDGPPWVSQLLGQLV